VIKLTNEQKKEIRRFNNIEDLYQNLFLHGSANIFDNFKIGAEIPIKQRGGGYGQDQHSVSLTTDLTTAQTFATCLKGKGYVYLVLLKKDAYISTFKDNRIDYAEDLEDYLEEYEEYDAVYIGGGEYETVVLNVDKIVNLGIIQTVKAHEKDYLSEEESERYMWDLAEEIWGQVN